MIRTIGKTERRETAERQLARGWQRVEAGDRPGATRVFRAAAEQAEEPVAWALAREQWAAALGEWGEEFERDAVRAEVTVALAGRLAPDDPRLVAVLLARGFGDAACGDVRSDAAVCGRVSAAAAALLRGTDVLAGVLAAAQASAAAGCFTVAAALYAEALRRAEAQRAVPAAWRLRALRGLGQAALHLGDLPMARAWFAREETARAAQAPAMAPAATPASASPRRRPARRRLAAA